MISAFQPSCHSRQRQLSTRSTTKGYERSLALMSRSAKVLSRSGNAAFAKVPTQADVSEDHTSADIEVLARMAARFAGRDPDEHVRIKLGSIVAFEDAIWRYPDFIARAHAACRALVGPLDLRCTDDD